MEPHDTKAYTALWVEDVKNTQIKMQSQTVRFLTPDIAVAHLTWEMTGDPGMPGHPVPGGNRGGIFTHVIQITKDGWRFVASQNTDILPIPDFLKAR